MGNNNPLSSGYRILCAECAQSGGTMVSLPGLGKYKKLYVHQRCAPKWNKKSVPEKLKHIDTLLFKIKGGINSPAPNSPDSGSQSA